MDKERAKQTLAAWCELNGVKVLEFDYDEETEYLRFSNANPIRVDIEFIGYFDYEIERNMPRYLTVDQALDALDHLDERRP